MAVERDCFKRPVAISPQKVEIEILASCSSISLGEHEAVDVFWWNLCRLALIIETSSGIWFVG